MFLIGMQSLLSSELPLILFFLPSKENENKRKERNVCIQIKLECASFTYLCDCCCSNHTITGCATKNNLDRNELKWKNLFNIVNAIYRIKNNLCFIYIKKFIIKVAYITNIII